MKLKWNVIRNNKMCLVYSWQHWFWITAIIIALISNVTSHPLSSYETLSTSLKSALIQSNENSFQKSNNQQKVQLTSGIKSALLTSETSDTADTFGGASVSEMNAEMSAKNKDWIHTPESTSTTEISTTITSITTTTTLSASVESTTKTIATKTENKNTAMKDVENNEAPTIVAALSLPNVNSTKNSTIISSIATTILTTVTESIDNSSQMKTSTAPTTTKLIKVEEIPPESEQQQQNILNVKPLNLTSMSDVIEPISNDYNDTVEIIMTDDVNATEISDFTNDRKSKGLLGGFSEEASKFVNNISSRSTLQVSHENEIIVGGDDDLSSEALFDMDEDNGGIAMSATLVSVICVGIVASLSTFSVMLVYVYRQRFINKPQTLSEPDSSGYNDDSSIRDNSDELYSLDNDSFLNSLEAMTIQNYWTDSVKHTKL